MNTILKYIGLSLKKNFIHRINGIMVIADTMIDCFSIWLLWASLTEAGINILNWNKQALQLFMGYSLISMSISVLFVGSYDIEKHIINGTLDIYLIKPFNPIITILLERANFLRYIITMPVGLVFVLKSVVLYDIVDIVLSIYVCIVSTVSVKLISVIIYELSFWLKKTTSLARVAECIYSVATYPMTYISGKLLSFFTHVIPIACIATIPTNLSIGQLQRTVVIAPTLCAFSFSLIVLFLWKAGIHKYESTN